ncbi:hypothetical protein [Shewanella algae]|uniref:hypothetical protein n=1 Tax=Shewanella algae TaxID=38313 RepID=UPI0031F502D4
MYSQFFSSPTIVNLSMPTRLCFSLPDSVSDFVLSEALRSPLLEWVMLEGEDKASQGQFILRLQPFLTQQLLPLESVRKDGVSRTAGQGFRLYSEVGTSTSSCITALRQGVCLDLWPGQTFLCSLQTGRFELLPLEQDLRLSQEPREIILAKTALAEAQDYQASSEKLAVQLSEVTQARIRLERYQQAHGAKLPEGLLNEVWHLLTGLSQKRQWLLRCYNQSLERPNYRQSANHDGTEEKLRRALECYELLSSPELNAMVRQLTDEE